MNIVKSGGYPVERDKFRVDFDAPEAGRALPNIPATFSPARVIHAAPSESVATQGALDGRAKIDTCKDADSLRPGSIAVLAGRFSSDARIALAVLLAVPVGFMVGALLSWFFIA